MSGMHHHVLIPEDPPKKFEKEPSLTVVFIDISRLSQKSQFLICCSAVFILYILYGYLQELIFSFEGFKPYGWYLTLVQFAFYSVFGYAELTVASRTRRKIPLKVYALLAGFTLGTMGFSNSSISYLNYPTQVIFKCCKLIPVMIGSIIIQKKKYKIIDYASAALMCVGLSYFTLADSKVSPHFNLFGVFLISCALLCDAAIGNVQEKSMKQFEATNTEVVFYSYSIGFIYLLIIMFLTGDLYRGFIFCIERPEIYGLSAIFSVSGYLGVNVVLSLVRSSGALLAVTVTTCRKAISILLSFVMFSKPFTIHYLWSGLIVLLGIYLNVLSKNPKFIPPLPFRRRKRTRQLSV